MSEVIKKYATDETFREVADLLYGGGAEDLIRKANPDGADLAAKKAKSERTQTRVAQASNVVGLAAGIAGTGAALRDDRLASGGKLARKVYRAGQKIPSPISSKTGKVGAALAGGALGLQVGNIAGDAVTTAVLNRAAKKQGKYKKIEKRRGGKLVPVALGSGGLGAGVGMSTAQRKAKVKKSIAEIKENASFPTSKGKLTQASITTAARAGGEGAEYVKSGKLKKLPNKVKTIQGKVKKSTEIDVMWEGEISKVDEDKRQVFGWASIVEMNGEKVVDLQGDYISIEEVEKSAYEYIQKSRKGGDMHLRDEWDEPKHTSDMIESFVVTEEKKKALGLPPETPTGWWVGYQVNDPELWSKVKNGERTGFSIHGRGVRSEM